MLQAVRHSLRRVAARPASSLSTPSSLRALTPSPPSFLHSQQRCPFHHGSFRSAFTYPSSRSLDELVKLPMLLPHTREEIQHIWQQYHATPQNQTAMADDLTAEEYQTFVEHAAKAPLFVVPSFRLNETTDPSAAYTFDTSGFEMMLVNVQQASLLLTSLEEYKSRGASAATPYAVITFYPDLSASKDLVLVRGEMLDVNVTIPQLRQIWILLREYFISSPSSFAEFPGAFNRKPNPQFDFERYVQQCTETVKGMKIEQRAQAGKEGDVKQGEFVAEAETTPIAKA